jgi:hypothetical protein
MVVISLLIDIFPGFTKWVFRQYFSEVIFFSFLDTSVRTDIHVAKPHKHAFGPVLVNSASARVEL